MTEYKVPSIELIEIAYSYGQMPLFNNLSITFKGFGLHGLLGPNGAGKSSLMKLMSGLIMPHNGQVLINGKNPYDIAQKNIINSVGLLTDFPPLYRTLTVNQYLEFCSYIRNIDDVSKSVANVLNQLDLFEVKNKIIQTLSTGYRQRVALAQALIHSPEILILDEPTLGLDPKSSYELRSYLKKISSNHLIILSSHLLHDVEQLCEDVTLLSKGKVLFHGKMQDAIKVDRNQNKTLIKIRGDASKDDVQNVFKDLNLQIMKFESNDSLIQIIFDTINDSTTSLLIQKLSSKGLILIELTPLKEDLEESFINLVSNNSLSRS